MQIFKAVFFDLDGTLADNYTAIYLTAKEVFESLGLPAPTYDEIYHAVGGSILVTIQKLLPADKIYLAEEIGALYIKKNPKYIFEGLKAMPFAAEFLETLTLRGIRVACFTNKQQEGAEAVLKHLGLAKFMSKICGTSLNSSRKPDAAFTLEALAKMNVSASESLFIGDSPYDWKAAENGGAPCALVATGSDSFESLSSTCLGALGVFKNFKDLARGIFDIEL